MVLVKRKIVQQRLNHTNTMLIENDGKGNDILGIMILGERKEL